MIRCLDMDDLRKLADLIRQRNDLEVAITRIIRRPAQIGHIGEYIAARVFGIALASSATEKGNEGRFEEGLLRGRTVNIKWYAKREEALDIEPRSLPDFYLVLTGPHGLAGSSKGKTRPWLISSVFLFDAQQLLDDLAKAGVKVGDATSVRKRLWDAAELWPSQRNTMFPLNDGQRGMLSLFG
jgi:hypothetical protein